MSPLDMAVPGGLGRRRAFPDRRKNLPPENHSPAEGPPIGENVEGCLGMDVEDIVKQRLDVIFVACLPTARLSVRANRPDVFQELQPRRLSVPLHAAGSSRSERTVLKPERIVGPSEPSYACGRSVRANRPARGWLQRAGLRGPHPSVRANRPDARSVRANRPEDRFQPNSPPPSHSIEVGMVAFHGETDKGGKKRESLAGWLILQPSRRADSPNREPAPPAPPCQALGWRA